MRQSKTILGTLYAAGGRYEVKSAATLAELYALRSDGSIRAFQDSAPKWAQRIVSDVTSYFNVSSHVKLLVSVNAKLPSDIAQIVLGNLDDVNDSTMRSTHCDWLLSDGTENLERYVQLFGRPEKRRIRTDGPAQNYYLEFGYSIIDVPSDDDLLKRLDDLFSYLIMISRFEPAEDSLPAAYGRHVTKGVLVHNVKQ